MNEDIYKQALEALIGQLIIDRHNVSSIVTDAKAGIMGNYKYTWIDTNSKVSTVQILENALNAAQESVGEV